MRRQCAPLAVRSGTQKKDPGVDPGLNVFWKFDRLFAFEFSKAE